MPTQTHLQRRVLSGVLLLGSFAFGFNAATALHELGHAIAAWGYGAKVTKVFVHPFSWSYTTWWRTELANEAVMTWAGAVFGLVGAMIAYALGLWLRRPMAGPLVMTGIAACFYNGLYFVVDAIARTGGDADELLKMGTPLWALLAFGGLVTALGFALTAPAMPMMGIRKDDSLGARVLIFELGFGPYLLAMILYHVISGEQVGLWAMYGGIGLVLAALAGWLSGVVGRRISTGVERPVSVVAAGVSLALGVGCVVVELVLFGDFKPGL